MNVDLGLPSGTLWATYNVGATSPYEKGQYFAWGEVEPREDFSDSVMEGTCRLPELAGGIYLVSYTCNGNTMTTQKITIK